MKESAKTAQGRQFQYEMGSRPRPGQGLVIGADYVEGCYYCRVLVRVFGGLAASPFEKSQMLKTIEWMQMSPHNWLCFRCKDLPEARQAAPRRNNSRVPLTQGFGIVDQQGNLVGFAQAGGAPQFPQAAPPPEQMPAQGIPQQLAPQQPQQQQLPPQQQPPQLPPQQQAPPQQAAPQQPPHNGHAQPTYPQQPAYPHAVPAPQQPPPQQMAPPQQYAPQPQQQYAPQQQPYTQPAFQQPQYAPPPPQQPQAHHRDYSMLGRRARKDWRMHSGTPVNLAPERPPPQHVHMDYTTPGAPEPDLGRARAIAEGDPNAPQPALGGTHPPTLTAGPTQDPSQPQS